MDRLREEIMIIVGAAYAGGAIDKANNRDTKLDFGKIPEHSKVIAAIDQLLTLITKEVTKGKIEELEHIDDPVNVRLYFEGLISVKDRINELNKDKE